MDYDLEYPEKQDLVGRGPLERIHVLTLSTGVHFTYLEVKNFEQSKDFQPMEILQNPVDMLS